GAEGGRGSGATSVLVGGWVPVSTSVRKEYAVSIGRAGHATLGRRLSQDDSKFVELFLRRVARRPGHRIHPGLILREGDCVPQVRLAREDHDHAIDAEGDP